MQSKACKTLTLMGLIRLKNADKGCFGYWKPFVSRKKLRAIISGENVTHNCIKQDALHIKASNFVYDKGLM